MSAFKLKRKESAKQGIRRVAHGRAQDAIGLLRDPEADPVKAVHEARKDVKKLRGTLKLVRPVLGADTYRHENERYRKAGRLLSDVRDAQVRTETVDALAERFPDDAPRGGWDAIRRRLAGDAPGKAELESRRELAAVEIEGGDDRIDDWKLDGKGFELLRPGLKRAYSRGRKRFRAARKEQSDEWLHEWRKRSKDLWYHLRLVRRCWPEVLDASADEAHELSDRLGDDHDLAILREYILSDEEPLTEGQRDHVLGLISKRRAELQADAFAYGERLFAEKPKRFVGRLGAYFTAKPL